MLDWCVKISSLFNMCFLWPQRKEDLKPIFFLLDQRPAYSLQYNQVFILPLSLSCNQSFWPMGLCDCLFCDWLFQWKKNLYICVCVCVYNSSLSSPVANITITHLMEIKSINVKVSHLQQRHKCRPSATLNTFIAPWFTKKPVDGLLYFFLIYSRTSN